MKARAPFQPAPITMPMEASSSSAWMMANLCLLGFGIDAHLGAMAGKRIRQRRRRRDRIPGADCGAAIDRAERRRRIALDEDAVADLAALLQAQADRAREVESGVVASDMQRLDVGRDQLFLALILLADQLLDHLDVHVDECSQNADINDVLEQLALARIGVFAVADRGQRHADDRDVLAEFGGRQRLGRIVEQVAARLDAGNITVESLRIHRHHQVGAAACAEMARLGDAHLVPGRQALNVGREDVARRHRHAHAQNGAGEHLVRARRSGAVDVGEADDEVVYAADRRGGRHEVPA